MVPWAPHITQQTATLTTSQNIKRKALPSSSTLCAHHPPLLCFLLSKEASSYIDPTCDRDRQVTDETLSLSISVEGSELDCILHWFTEWYLVKDRNPGSKRRLRGRRKHWPHKPADLCSDPWNVHTKPEALGHLYNLCTPVEIQEVETG